MLLLLVFPPFRVLSVAVLLVDARLAVDPWGREGRGEPSIPGRRGDRGEFLMTSEELDFLSAVFFSGELPFLAAALSFLSLCSGVGSLVHCFFFPVTIACTRFMVESLVSALGEGVREFLSKLHPWH